MTSTQSVHSERHPTSHSLIERVQQHETTAWTQLVNLYSPLVYYWCKETGLQEVDAGDVYQNVFQSVAKGIHTYRNQEKGSFRGWLRTLTRNKLKDFYRQAERTPTPVGGTDALKQFEQIPTEGNSTFWDSEQEIHPEEEKIHKEILKKTLARIRPLFADNTWKAFWMVVIDGRETSDVAADLDMKPGTVRVAKSRILKRLRHELGDI